MSTTRKQQAQDDTAAVVTLQGRALIAALDADNADKHTIVSGPLVTSNVSLSFWGGIDPVTGIVIDQQHPLVGQCVRDTILCLPSGRGSCTASQVLLELILNGIAPAAILLRDPDGLVAVGALIGQEVFEQSVTIVCLEEQFAKLLLYANNDSYNATTHAAVRSDGRVFLGNNEAILLQQARQEEETSLAMDTTSTTTTTHDQFTDEEHELLAKASNSAQRMVLRVIFRYARIVSSSPDDDKQQPSYTPVSKAHIDGCTYIGPGGLAFVQRLVQKGGRVTVPTTLNSVSTDRRNWQALGVPAEYAQNAIALGDAYLELGCLPSFTCAPYLLANPPTVGQDLVWGESNAVVYANSVLGARTEKYADYLDICGAIAGIVPRTGAHVTENRVPSIVLDAKHLFAEELTLQDESFLDLDALFPVLGHLCGSLADGKVPILIGLEPWSKVVSPDHLKAFCAAFGTTGTSPLIHIAGITPEALDAVLVQEWVDACGASRALVTLQGLESTHAILDKKDQNNNGFIPIDLIALGNPHLSVTECQHLTSLVETVGGTKRDNVRIIGCISREVYNQADKKGFIRPLKNFGMEFISDTCWCMLLDPPVIPANPNGATLTNSGKYAHYGPGLTNRRFRFAGTRDCVEAAITGTYPLRQPTQGGRPSWLKSQNALQRRSNSILRSLRGFLPR